MPTTTGKATDFITFSRASLATVTDSDGKIKWAGHNMLSNSESFDASSWAKTNYVVAANDAVAPDGTITADKITTNATTSEGLLRATTSQTVSTRHTLSVFAKAGNVNFLRLRNLAVASQPNAWFNLSTGAVATVGSGLTASITAVGSGWYLCSITGTTEATISFNLVDVASSATDNTTAIVSGDFIYVWGAHLYRSDLGGMVLNPARGDAYYPTTPRNLLGFTEDFSNAYWTRDGVQAFGSGSIANAITAPNGLQNAEKIAEAATTAQHYIFTSAFSYVANGVYTASVYAKAGERTILQSSLSGVSGLGANAYANFDLVNGTVSASGTGVTATIQSVGNGWYRCATTATYSTGGSGSHAWFIQTSGTAARGASYTGDGTSGIYLWGAQLSDSASLDPYVANAFAAPTAAAYHGPRLDFDPVTQAAKGLLVEEQRTNSISLSSEISSWGSNSGVTATSNDTNAPDGTATADKFIPSASTAYVLRQASSASAVHTVSIYAKAISSTNAWISFLDLSANIARAWINVFTGAKGTTQAGYSSTITPVGNNWYRCTFTQDASVANPFVQINISNADNSPTAIVDGTNGVYLWGCQVEAGSFATSYIPTGASTVTRAADVASVSTQAFPYSASVGSIVVGWRAGQNSSTAARVIWMDDTDTGVYDNFVTIRQGGNVSTAGAEGAARVNAGTATTAIATSPAITVGSTYKAGFAFAANDFALSVNGQAPVTNGSGAVPTGIDLMRIGGHRDGTYINGHIRQITYIPRRLSNAELQARTA